MDLIPASEYQRSVINDILDADDVVAKGEATGHPFRGNQWTGGISGGAESPRKVRNPQTLVVEDWNNRSPDINDLLDKIGREHILRVTPTERHDERNKRMVTGYRIDFDADAVRNSYAHNYAFNRGWIGHLELPDTGDFKALASRGGPTVSRSTKTKMGSLVGDKARQYLYENASRWSVDYPNKAATKQYQISTVESGDRMGTIVWAGEPGGESQHHAFVDQFDANGAIVLDTNTATGRSWTAPGVGSTEHEPILRHIGSFKTRAAARKAILKELTVAKGEGPGHPFRGNQWTGGIKGGGSVPRGAAVFDSAPARRAKYGSDLPEIAATVKRMTGAKIGWHSDLEEPSIDEFTAVAEAVADFTAMFPNVAKGLDGINFVADDYITAPGAATPLGGWRPTEDGGGEIALALNRFRSGFEAEMPLSERIESPEPPRESVPFATEMTPERQQRVIYQATIHELMHALHFQAVASSFVDVGMLEPGRKVPHWGFVSMATLAMNLPSMSETEIENSAAPMIGQPLIDVAYLGNGSGPVTGPPPFPTQYAAVNWCEWVAETGTAWLLGVDVPLGDDTGGLMGWLKKQQRRTVNRSTNPGGAVQASISKQEHDWIADDFKGSVVFMLPTLSSRLAKGDRAGHPFRGNQWVKVGADGGSTPGMNPANRANLPKYALQQILANDGVSIRVTSGSQPKSGFMASLSGHEEMLGSVDDVTPNTIRQFVAKNKAVLALPNHHLGGWLDRETGRVYLDVSRRFRTPEEAIRFGVEHDQIAILQFHGDAEPETIYLKGEAATKHREAIDRVLAGGTFSKSDNGPRMVRFFLNHNDSPEEIATQIQQICKEHQ